MSINHAPPPADSSRAEEVPASLADSESQSGGRARLTSEDLETLRRADEHSDRRLALLVFLATLAANLVALIGSLADASDLIVPTLGLVEPMPRLHIAGSATILGDELRLATDWQAQFEALTATEAALPLVGDVERTVKVTMAPVGTLAGIEDALSGRVNLLAASEPISSAALQRLATAGIGVTCAATIGYDVIGFVTNVNNRLPRALNAQELAGILAGTITDWSQVGGAPERIRVFARQGSGTTDLVLRTYVGTSEFPAHLIPCDSQAECLNLTLSTPGSLYWVSTAWLRTQPRGYLHPVLIQEGQGSPVDPLSNGFDPSQYPADLVRPLYMYVLSSASMDTRSIDLAEQFLRYVRGVQGQQVLEAHYFHTHFTPPPGAAINLPPGFGLQRDGPPVVCR